MEKITEDPIITAEGVMSPEGAWNMVLEIMDKQVAEKYSGFFSPYQTWHQARQLILKRQSFYEHLLSHPHLAHDFPEIGEVNLEIRLRLALFNTRATLVRINDRLDSTLLEFPSRCLLETIKRQERTLRSERHNNPMVSRMLLIDAPILSYPKSKCEKTGVCQCLGAKEPYMSACINDASILSRRFVARQEVST